MEYNNTLVFIFSTVPPPPPFFLKNGNSGSIERLQLEQQFGQPGSSHLRKLDKLFSEIGVLRNRISTFDAVAASKNRLSIGEKKRESPLDITVTVKHDGDIVVFHASENYRFHQLLDDACHYWQRTKPSGER